MAAGRPDREPPAELFAWDLALGSDTVAGTDEAGRGCLAGPIVAAAVRFSRDCLEGEGDGSLAGLGDSKQLTAAARRRLCPAVMATAEAVSVTVRSSRFIDEHGIQRANLEVLAEALIAVSPPDGAPEPVRLVDGFSLPGCELEHRRLVRGDATSATVAAASVVAKVVRDRIMEGLSERHPGYGFEGHKGYASSAHREAIVELGPSPVHRLSFASAAYEEAARRGQNASSM